MSSHLCFNERFSLELHVNPLTHNRVCCCQMRLENGIFILLEQASKSWTRKDVRCVAGVALATPFFQIFFYNVDI